MAGVTMSPARNRAYFENPATLTDHLADQLARGRLAIVIGAGASMGFGLPSWASLLDRCLELRGISRIDGPDPEALAERVLVEGCGNDDVTFARLVATALYENFDLSFETLRQKPLLAAIGALIMLSHKQSSTRIISYNFDDLLGRYLRQGGFAVKSVDELQCWAGTEDVTVYHPHGLLPSGTPPEQINRPICFAAIHFDRLRTNKPLWASLLREILSSHTCLFIGLSGDDHVLRTTLYEAHSVHAAKSSYAFWGVRFSNDPADKSRVIFEERGVYQHTLRTYDDLPGFLFTICEQAARRMAQPDL
jgi:hypothetical protein